MTEQNPFRAPDGNSPAALPRGSQRDYLIRIAKAQRHVLLVILAYICLVPLNFVQQFSQTGETVFYAACAVVVLAGMVTTYRLASLFNTRFLAFLYTIGLVIPFLGLFLLYVVSHEATSILQARGIKVGLLGANPNRI